MPVEFNPDFTIRQTQALDLLDSSECRRLLYGGCKSAKGGGKSVFGCYWVMLYCLGIVAEFELKPSQYPPAIGWMGRKQSVDFSNTTLETWKRFIPPGLFRINQQASEIIIGETVKIDFGGLDRAESLNKFNSAEYGFFFLDQAEETGRDDVSVLQGSLRLTLKGKALPYKELYTANPAQCWLKDEFLTVGRPGNHFVRALPSDNPHLPGDYIATLEAAFAHRPELLRAYRDGDWDALSGFNVCISQALIEGAHGRRLFPQGEPIRVLACDPARFGDDQTVIYCLEDTEIVAQAIYGQKDTVHTANEIMRQRREWSQRAQVPASTIQVAVDTCGIGGGVADNLVSQGVDCWQINSAEVSTKPDDYANLRAELWLEAAKEFSAGEIGMRLRDPELDGQLSSAQYSVATRGRLAVEPKIDIKDRMGRSPDKADAYLIGLHVRRVLQHRAGGSAGMALRRASAEPVGLPPADSYAWHRQQAESRQEEMSY